MHVSTHNQLADLLTKVLHPEYLQYLLDKMGMKNIHPPSGGGVSWMMRLAGTDDDEVRWAIRGAKLERWITLIAIDAAT